MFTIQLEIDVENAVELIQNQKGPLVAMFSSALMNEKDLKVKVESMVRKEIIANLKNSMQEEFLKQNVKASIKIY